MTEGSEEPLQEGGSTQDGATSGRDQDLLGRLQTKIEENTKLALRVEQLERALSAERETRRQLGTALEQERKRREQLDQMEQGDRTSDVRAELERTRARCEALERQLRSNAVQQRQAEESEREPAGRFRLRRGRR